MKGTPAITYFLFLVIQAWTVVGQDSTRNRPALVITKSAVQQIDHFGTLSSEDRSARFDNLFHQISQVPGSVGYIFLFCGKKCRYGEIEAHQRGIEIKIGLRQFARGRLVVLNAGFRESFETELWLSRDWTTTPLPKSTVNIRYVEFAKASGRVYEMYDCCDDYSDFWKNLKP